MKKIVLIFVILVNLRQLSECNKKSSFLTRLSKTQTLLMGEKTYFNVELFVFSTITVSISKSITHFIHADKLGLFGGYEIDPLAKPYIHEEEEEEQGTGK